MREHVVAGRPVGDDAVGHRSVGDDAVGRRRSVGRRSVGRSVVALLSGLLVTVVLSYGTDAVLQLAGVLPSGRLNIFWGLVALVIGYRSVFGAVGSYLAARLAPVRPMGHALGLGIFGLIGGIGGAIASWNSPLTPSWYALTLAALAVPSAWLGGIVHQRSRVMRRRS